MAHWAEIKVLPGLHSFLEVPGTNPSSSFIQVVGGIQFFAVMGLKSLFLAGGQGEPLHSLRSPASLISLPLTRLQTSKGWSFSFFKSLFHPSATSLLPLAEERCLFLRTHLIKLGSLRPSRVNFLF